MGSPQNPIRIAVPPPPVIVYISGRFSRRDVLRAYRDQLLTMGYYVASRWLDEEGGTPEEWYGELALRDIVDINRSTVFVRDTLEVGRHHGCEVETGIAIAKAMPFFRVGPSLNIFHRLANKTFATWDDALGYFDKWRK